MEEQAEGYDQSLAGVSRGRSEGSLRRGTGGAVEGGTEALSIGRTEATSCCAESPRPILASIRSATISCGIPTAKPRKRRAMSTRLNPLFRVAFAALVAGASAGGASCDGGIGASAAFEFDPETCSEEESGSTIIFGGLDAKELFAIERTVFTATGRFDSASEALAGLSFGGPPVDLTLREELTPWERWEALPNDFGAVALVDLELMEVAFSGSMIRGGGESPQDPVPADPEIRFGGAVSIPVQVGNNPNWQLSTTATRVSSEGLRSEEAARYAACGDAVALVYVHTPLAAGPMSPSNVARGIFVLHGHRARGSALR